MKEESSVRKEEEIKTIHYREETEREKELTRRQGRERQKKERKKLPEEKKMIRKTLATELL